MENNKNTQRWDMPNFDGQSSNDSDDNAECFGKMLIVEEEDDQDEVQFEHREEEDDLMDFKE